MGQMGGAAPASGGADKPADSDQEIQLEPATEKAAAEPLELDEEAFVK